jgi:putative transposase
MSFGPPLNHSFRFGSAPTVGPINANQGAGENRCPRGQSLRPSFTFCAPAVSGRRCPRNLGAPVRFTSISRIGTKRGFFWSFGGPDWRNMTRWKGSPWIGKALTGPWAKLPWRKNVPGPTRRIGGKKGRKRSVLTDGRGVPLSIVGSAANVHDVTLLVPTLDSLVIARPKPTPAHPQNLCADASDKGQPAMEAVLAHHYTPHVKQRREEAQAKRTQPGFRARRWVAEPIRGLTDLGSCW